MIAEKYLTDTLGHGQQVARVMSHFARTLGQDEDVWYAAGLLHDVDWDLIGKDAHKHLGDEFVSIMDELFVDSPDSKERFVDDVRSHYEQWGVPVDSLMRKYLISVDELSGLIHAYSLMRPE